MLFLAEQGARGATHELQVTPLAERWVPCSLSPVQLSGVDVVVVVEDVLGVVAPLELEQPRVVRAVGGPDRVAVLVVAEVVEPAALVEVRGEGAVRLARPGDVLVGRGRDRARRTGMSRFQPSARCGTAVSVTPTRVTAPWKCSSRSTVIGDGTDA